MEHLILQTVAAFTAISLSPLSATDLWGGGGDEEPSERSLWPCEMHASHVLHHPCYHATDTGRLQAPTPQTPTHLNFTPPLPSSSVVFTHQECLPP